MHVLNFAYWYSRTIYTTIIMNILKFSKNTISRGYKGTNIKSKLLAAYRSRIGLSQAISCLPTLDMFACENLSSNILKRTVA